jgi:large subunit ribosomal protein L9
MKVLLQSDVESVGKAGEIVNVKDGFARNYLIPRKLAVVADEKNVRVFEHLKRQTEDRIRKQRKAAEALKEKIESLTLTIPCKVGEEGKLFGSVTNIQIAEALKSKGIELDRKKIILEKPIKVLGDYEALVKLEGDITAKIKISLVKEE